MPNIGTLTVQLVAQAEQFERTMRGAQRTMEATAKHFARTAKQMERLGKDWMMRLTAPLALAGGGALKLAADMEQTRIAFTNMLGSAQAAQDFLDRLAKFAEKTPFEYTDLVQQARRLMAFGWAAEEVIPTLTAVGDAVAAMGGNAEMIERVTTALGQMRAKQRVSAEEMMQLTEAGIPAWDMLAAAVGKSVPEVMKLAEKGLIPANAAIAALLRAMEQRWGGLMAQQMDTVSGATSNLMDVLKRLGWTLGEAIDRTFRLRQRIQWLTGVVSSAADALARMNPVLRSAIIWLGLAAALAGPVIFGLGTMARFMSVAATGMAVLSFWASRIVKAFAAWRSGTASLIGALASGLGTWRLVALGIGAVVAITVLAATHWRQLAAFAHAAWATVGAAALYGASLVVRGVGLILAGIGAIIPAVRGAAQAVLGLADSLKGAAAQSWASAQSALQMARTGQQAQNNQNALAKAGKNAAKAQEQVAEGINKAAEAAADNIQSFDQVHQIQEEMAKSPAATMPEMPAFDMAGVVPGIGGIGAALGEQLAGVADAAAAAWNRLKQAMEPVNRAVEWIRTNWPTIGPIVEGIAGLITVLLIPALIKTGVEAMIAGGKVLASWAMQAAGAVVHGATMVGQLVLAGAKWAWLGIQAMLNAGKVVLAWAMQGWQAVASVAVQVAQFVILGAKWVWMGVVALANAARMAAAWFVALGPVGWVLAIITLVATVVALNWERVKAVTLQVWSAVTAWLSAVWAQIGAWVSEAWARIAATIAGWWQSVLGVTQGIWSAIAGWLSAAWSQIAAWASAVWSGLATTISAWWQSIWTATVEVWSAVASWLSAAWASLVALATAVWTWLAEWIAGAWTAIRDVTAAVWQAISGFLSGLWQAISATAQAVWSAITQCVAAKWDEIRAGTTAIWQAVASWLSGLWQGILSTASSTWQSIVTWVSTKWAELQAGTQAVWTAVTTWLSSVWQSLMVTVSSTWQTISQTISNWWDRTVSATRNAWDGLKQWLGGLWDRLVQSAAEFGRRVMEAFKNAIGSIRLPIPSISISWREGPLGIDIPSLHIGVNWRALRDLIPWLAEGGIIDRPTIVGVGERGPEAVVPLGRTELAQEIAQAVAQAAYAAIRDAFRIEVARGRTGTGQQEIVLRLNDRTLARALMPALIAEAQRTGLPIIVRPQGA